MGAERDDLSEGVDYSQRLRGGGVPSDLGGGLFLQENTSKGEKNDNKEPQTGRDVYYKAMTPPPQCSRTTDTLSRG